MAAPNLKIPFASSRRRPPLKWAAAAAATATEAPLISHAGRLNAPKAPEEPAQGFAVGRAAG